MTSLTDSLTPSEPKIASDKSKEYLVSLLATRGVEATIEAFDGLDQQTVSAMIDVENAATPEQIERVQKLAKQLRIPGTITSKDRFQADRQIADMEASLRRMRAARPSVSAEVRQDAEAFLAALTQGVQEASEAPAPVESDEQLVPAGAVDDDIPF